MCWWYFSLLQRLSKIVRYSVHSIGGIFLSLPLRKNFRYSVHNVNAYVNTFFSFKLLLGGNTFFMEYLSATASSDILQKSFWERF